MIKRIKYDKSTGDINAFLATSIVTDYINDELELYCEAAGTETNITELSGVKSLLVDKQWANVTSKTEELINYGFEYEGVRFWTNQEAQQNYTGLYIMKDSALVTYPYTIWDGTGYVDIQNVEQMEEFCSLVMEHVETARVTGKIIRETLSGMSELELVNFVDPRTE